MERNYLQFTCMIIQQYLTEQESIIEDFIVRSNLIKIQNNGELYFPLYSTVWKKYLETVNSHDLPIYKLLNETNHSELIEELIQHSQSWLLLPIDKCLVSNNKMNIFLNRRETFKIMISQILMEGNNYGYGDMDLPYALSCYNCMIGENIENLSHLRIHFMMKMYENIRFKSNTISNLVNPPQTLLLTYDPRNGEPRQKIVIGIVICNNRLQRDINVTAEEYYKERIINVHLMTQHRVGGELEGDDNKWRKLFANLGHAAVVFDLLTVKFCRPVVLNFESSLVSINKEASFVLYNCARIAGIIKKFNNCVENGIYPPLPHFSKIDVSLLNQQEEWEIMFVHLMHYSYIVKSCVDEVRNCKLNVHNLCNFLQSLSSTFSIYYRKTKILIQPKEHLIPVLHARIYFLKALEIVYRNALYLMTIDPVDEM